MRLIGLSVRREAFSVAVGAILRYFSSVEVSNDILKKINYNALYV
jgi:hypothetical protein